MLEYMLMQLLITCLVMVMICSLLIAVVETFGQIRTHPLAHLGTLKDMHMLIGHSQDQDLVWNSPKFPMAH